MFLKHSVIAVKFIDLQIDCDSRVLNATTESLINQLFHWGRILSHDLDNVSDLIDVKDVLAALEADDLYWAVCQTAGPMGLIERVFNPVSFAQFF